MILITGTLAALFIYFLIMGDTKTESFTDNATFAPDKVVNLFNGDVDANFIQYLEALVDSNNPSDNLISRDVYNRLKSKPVVTERDILNEI